MDLETVSATEFKAKCLDLLNQVGARQIERLEITKRGKVVAVLIPPTKPGGCGAPPPRLPARVRGHPSRR